MRNTLVSEISPLRVDIHKPVPKRAIRALADIIAKKFDPDKIILFGSYAYGRPRAVSDVDILVVMDTPDGEWSLMEAIRQALPRRTFGLDVLVKSQAEIERRIAIDDWFLQDIVTKGKVLYERNHGRVGSQSRKRLRRRTTVNASGRRRASYR